ncbi:MAG: hypothetical protein ACREMQ_12455 [Longimicrobiales bacterium]
MTLISGMIVLLTSSIQRTSELRMYAPETGTKFWSNRTRETEKLSSWLVSSVNVTIRILQQACAVGGPAEKFGDPESTSSLEISENARTSAGNPFTSDGVTLRGRVFPSPFSSASP